MDIQNYTTPEALKQAIIAMPFDSKLYVANVPNDEYHGSIGWSSSHAKKAFQSEQRLDRYLENNKANEIKEHYVFGDLTHDSVRYQPEEIDKYYCDSANMPSGQRNLGKALKAVFESRFKLDLLETGFNLKPEDIAEGRQLLSEIDKRQVIKPKAKREARVLANLILSQHTVSDAFANHMVIFELSVWHKMADGFIRKCRPDAFFPDIKLIFDWKTIYELIWTYATGESRHAFVKRELKREITKRDYLLSAGWYMDILGFIDDEDSSFMFVFVDKDSLEIYPPYFCGFEELQDERRRCYEAMKAIKSYKSKLIDGTVSEPLTMFLPNDDHIFTGNQREYMA